MVALNVPQRDLAASLASDPGEILDLLANFAADETRPVLIREVAGRHDGGGGHLAVSAFLRDLADALDNICPEE
ncbi:hypothetical protein RSWS8N_18084 [Cereibacter sphaeroides WS8N]|uniref:hypothetical protein n=1 Tax=Cereibacter sphaeroides TaxID=1063 RepID=UPI00020B0320|nr:hypothetical protein [Cereibacter sphaeroides]EGJ20095.1 hypothetical protein RSWS8N_18084 [Cereibacter sphaeroides WS8N]